MANQRRTYRVAERIQSAIAKELLRMADPRVYLVTITSVSVSPDLRAAKVFWMVHGGEERIAEAQEALTGACGHFRKFIAHELDIRHAPEVKFFYDDSLDEAERMNEIFESIRQNQK